MDINPKEKMSDAPSESRYGDHRQWAAKEVGKPWQLRFFRLAIRIGGRRLAYHFMYLVVLWYILLNADIRQRTRYYLDRRFPWREGELRKIWDSYRLVCSFGHILIDQAAVALIGPQIVQTVCVNKQELKKAVSADKGAVLLVSHLGCWQIAMSALGFLEKRVSAVMLPQGEDSPIARMISRTLPFSIIDPRKGMESILEMIKVLNSGEILTIMGDRAFGNEQNKLHVPFLGEEISLPSSPYRLAKAANTSLLILNAVRVDSTRYEIGLRRVIKLETPDADCLKAARSFTDTMEEFVRKHPYQFFNFFDMWE